MRALSLAALGFLFLSGCDAIGPDTEASASGRVVAAETGAPLAGVSVAFCLSRRLGCSVVEATETAGDGSFAIAYDPGDRLYAPLPLYINGYPYDDRYGLGGGSVLQGEHEDFGDVELAVRSEP